MASFRTHSENCASPCLRISCPICREDDLKLSDCSEVASCHHRFCTTCIEEWATRCSACPLCKQEMNALVTAQSTRKGPKRKVEHRQLEVADSAMMAVAEPDIRCQVCGSDEDADVLLLCDHCNDGYHTFCVDLDAVSEEDWYCHRCEASVRAVQRRQMHSLGRPPGRASLIQPIEAVAASEAPRRFRRLRRACEDFDENLMHNLMQESVA